MKLVLHVDQMRLVTIHRVPDLWVEVLAGLAPWELLKVVAFGGYSAHCSVHHLIDSFLVIVVSGRVKRLGHGLLLAQMLLKHIVLLLGHLVATHAHVVLVVVWMSSSSGEHGIFLDWHFGLQRYFVYWKISLKASMSSESGRTRFSVLAFSGHKEALLHLTHIHWIPSKLARLTKIQ